MTEYYRIKESTLTKIADSIRSATGKTGDISVDDMHVEIETGVSLPELSNEGSAEDLLFGKELIDGKGNKVTGSVNLRTIYTGTTTPTSNIGIDGDVYIVIGG